MNRRCIFIFLCVIVIFYFITIVLILAPSQGWLFKIPNKNFAPHYGGIVWCKQLRRKWPGDKYSVALASHPGSGNTWLRYLLQQATGIVTGSVYLDYSLRAHGFPAENVTDGTVLVVKTHEMKTRRFNSAVLLVRDPKDAILAEFNRMYKGHIGTAPQIAFTSKQMRINWGLHVKRETQGWFVFNKYWLTEFKRPMFIVHYEDLITNTRSILTKVLMFLNVNVTEKELNCAMKHKEGIFKRKKRKDGLDPYTHDMLTELQLVKSKVYNLIEEYVHNCTESCWSRRACGTTSHC